MCCLNQSPTGNDPPRRELEHADGRIEQCLGCGLIGVEFGTTYIVFSESDFFHFVQWFEGLRWEDEDTKRGKLRVGVDSETSTMLSLTRREAEQVADLLTVGARWLASSGQITEHDGERLPQQAEMLVH